MDKETLYTYFSIDFEGMNLGFDYTICETLDDVRDYLQMVETQLDDPEMKDARVIVKGIGMTRKAYADWVGENLIP